MNLPLCDANGFGPMLDNSQGFTTCFVNFVFVPASCLIYVAFTLLLDVGTGQGFSKPQPRMPISWLARPELFLCFLEFLAPLSWLVVSFTFFGPEHHSLAVVVGSLLRALVWAVSWYKTGLQRWFDIPLSLSTRCFWILQFCIDMSCFMSPRTLEGKVSLLYVALSMSLAMLALLTPRVISEVDSGGLSSSLVDGVTRRDSGEKDAWENFLANPKQKEQTINQPNEQQRRRTVTVNGCSMLPDGNVLFDVVVSHPAEKRNWMVSKSYDDFDKLYRDVSKQLRSMPGKTDLSDFPRLPVMRCGYTLNPTLLLQDAGKLNAFLTELTTCKRFSCVALECFLSDQDLAGQVADKSWKDSFEERDMNCVEQESGSRGGDLDQDMDILGLSNEERAAWKAIHRQ